MTARLQRSSSWITLFGILLFWMIAQASLALAHDSWINHGKYRNPAGEWCCGENDCDAPPEFVNAHLKLDQQVMAALRKNKVPVVPA